MLQLGKVIFYGIPHERVRQVVLSRLPALRGSYPLTPTLSLRITHLLSESNFAPVSVNAVRALFKLPRLTVGSDVTGAQTIHQLRFSMEYLIRSRLIDSQGTPLHPWYSLAAHLSTAEPSNFALLALFRSGYIHTLCEDGYIEAKRRLMHLLAFLFNRDYLSKSIIDKDTFTSTNRSPSKVILPPLDQKVYSVLARHNQEVLDTFTECAISYAMQQSKALGSDSKLPLSGHDVNAHGHPHSHPAASGDHEGSSFLADLKASRVPVRSRSAFVATSGHGDVYTSVDELVRTVRSGVNLNKHVLPYLETFSPTAVVIGKAKAGGQRSGSEETRYINAYLYDFYNHGQDKPLVQANHIPRGEVWYRLADFSASLASIVTSLGELILRDGKAEALQEEEEEAATAAAATTAAKARRRRSESPSGVPDDWAADFEPGADEKVTGGGAGSGGGGGGGAATAAAKHSAPSAGGGGGGGPIEKEKGDDAEAAAAARGEGGLIQARPSHVNERDWKVYEVFVQLQEDFGAKFTAMWA